MRALVVYESMFGNTRAIAEAVADGLSPYLPVEVVEVGSAPSVVDAEVGLLVVGGPTHVFGMSRPVTRRSAAEQAVTPLVSAGIGLREWLDRVRLPEAGVAAAVFDTRVSAASGRPLAPGSAAHAAARRLRRRGAALVVPPVSFFVSDTLGPLLIGEPERARRWAARLGSTTRPTATAATGTRS